MPGNRDRKNTVDRDCHKVMCQCSGSLGGVLLLIIGIFAAATPSRNELIKEGAGHLDRMRTGFDTGNFAIIPREDPEQKAYCDDVGQRLYDALGTNETEEIEKVVESVCANAMWWPADWGTGVSDETPCEVDVAPGADIEQIIELTVLDSVCKTLGQSVEHVKTYLGVSIAGTLFSLLALYHGRKAFCGTRSEEQPLLEGGGQKQKGDTSGNEYSSMEEGGPSLR
jgi:hypothetical protein